MIRIVVYINDEPIFVRSAINLGYVNSKDTTCRYKIDNGDLVEHKRTDGFVPLVKKMLDTIHGDEIVGFK